MIFLEVQGFQSASQDSDVVRRQLAALLCQKETQHTAECVQARRRTVASLTLYGMGHTM